MVGLQVIELRNDGAGFGFGISGSRNRQKPINKNQKPINNHQKPIHNNQNLGKLQQVKTNIESEKKSNKILDALMLT